MQTLLTDINLILFANKREREKEMIIDKSNLNKKDLSGIFQGCGGRVYTSVNMEFAHFSIQNMLCENMKVKIDIHIKHTHSRCMCLSVCMCEYKHITL